MTNTTNPLETLSPLGLKPLNKAWAKIEILLGLGVAFIGLVWALAVCAKHGEIPGPGVPHFQFLIYSLILFVLGGYLAMAGHRSHLYQSNNQLIAFVIEEIRKSAYKEAKP